MVTEIWSVAATAILAAGITDVIPLVPMNIDVGSGAPFHWTTEHGEKLLPFTVKGTGGPVNASTAAFVGEIELTTGEGSVVPVGRAATENLSEFEFVAGVPAETAMATAAWPVARKAVSAGVIAAVSCVALTKVVGRGDPFQLTTSPFANPVPFTASVRPSGLQNGVLFDEVVDADSDVMVGRTIANEFELDVLALDAGVATAIWAVPTEAISAAGIVAFNCAGLVGVAAMYVVANCVVALPLVHCTMEHGRRFVPVTVKAVAGVPAVADVGEIAAIVGAGGVEAEIVNGKAFERAPKLDTPIFTVAAEARSENGIAAVSCVELTNVVASTAGTAGGGLVIQSTTDPFTKFVPVTVRVTPEGLHEGVELEEVVEEDKEVTAGGAIVNGMEAEAVPPGFTAEIWAV